MLLTSFVQSGNILSQVCAAVISLLEPIRRLLKVYIPKDVFINLETVAIIYDTSSGDDDFEQHTTLRFKN